MTPRPRRSCKVDVVLQQAYACVSAIIAAERVRGARAIEGVEAFVPKLLGG